MRALLLGVNGLIIVCGLGLGAMAIGQHRWGMALAVGFVVVVAVMVFLQELERPRREATSRRVAEGLRRSEVRAILHDAEGDTTRAVRALRTHHRELTLRDAQAAIRRVQPVSTPDATHPPRKDSPRR